jgi:hypothetical protein
MSIFDLRDATLSARVRVGDPALGTRVSKGLFQVVRVVYVGRKSSVVELSGYGSLAAAISFLQAL